MAMDGTTLVKKSTYRRKDVILTRWDRLDGQGPAVWYGQAQGTINVRRMIPFEYHLEATTPEDAFAGATKAMEQGFERAKEAIAARERRIVTARAAHAKATH